MKPELVIFDCDGVLVDSETLSNIVLRDNLKRYGLNLTLEECIDRFVGGSISNVEKTVRAAGIDLPNTWIDEIYAAMYATLRDNVEAIPDILNVLDYLKQQKIPFCVASNGSTEKMGITLGRTGLLPLFEGAMFSAHELGVSKPDPELFLIAARQFNVPPAECLVIEDSASGATAAYRAGMKCFGFIAETKPEKLTPYCNILFDEMRNLPTLIQEFEG